MSYRLREHTADVGVEATGDSLDAVFAAVADGLTEAHCESVPDDVGEHFPVSVAAESREALLFDYLDELIYQRDVRNVLPVDNEVVIEETDDGYTLAGRARGVPIEEIDAREVKAVTYSEMRVEETEDGWYGYVVLDV